MAYSPNIGRICNRNKFFVLMMVISLGALWDLVVCPNSYLGSHLDL